MINHDKPVYVGVSYVQKKKNTVILEWFTRITEHHQWAQWGCSSFSQKCLIRTTQQNLTWHVQRMNFQSTIRYIRKIPGVGFHVWLPEMIFRGPTLAEKLGAVSQLRPFMLLQTKPRFASSQSCSGQHGGCHRCHRTYGADVNKSWLLKWS